MHYFKLNIGDYHKKAGRLTMVEHGAYTLLLHACYDRERFPTEDEALDWCWARTQEEIAAVKFVLSKFFVLTDGRYVQTRIQEEIDAFHQKAETNRAIAIEREARRRTNRGRSVSETQGDEHEPPPNQEPRTNNQEPSSVGEERRSPPLADCPHQAILAIWADKLPTAIQPREWTPARSALLKARWREKKSRQDLDWWSRLFGYITESDFLMGRINSPGRRPFELSIDWLLKQENFVRVIEGKYHSKAEVAA